jgi:hypothetical protein
LSLASLFRPALPANIKQGWRRLARDKHSSLLRNFVNYRCKKFHRIGPWCQKLATGLYSFNGEASYDTFKVETNSAEIHLNLLLAFTIAILKMMYVTLGGLRGVRNEKK